MQVVILCGGLGTRLREETEYRPKPMAEVGGRPILWHIMKHYSYYGLRDFILCLGYKGEVIRSYFLNYHAMNLDVTVDLKQPPQIHYHQQQEETDWKITLVDTGRNAQTGARLKRVGKYIDGRFMMTYGDGLADLNIHDLLATHERMGRRATVTGVLPPARFGELVDQDGLALEFREKPQTQEGVISGGFFVLEKEVLDLIPDDDESCNFERGPLPHLANCGQLAVHRHNGFWQCMDTYRDFTYLNELWESGNPPWRLG